MRMLSLWACVMSRGADGSDSAMNCSGFRYLEPGEAPGPCGQRGVKRAYSDGQRPIETKCSAAMFHVGDFEFGEDF